MVPYYYETNYNMAYLTSWWDWYSRAFFCRYTGVMVLILSIAQVIQIGARSMDWRKALILTLLVITALTYLLYAQFILTFFGFLADPSWYSKNRVNDYVQLSLEPARWGWGVAKGRDHVTYHSARTVFWYKQDGPFAETMLFFHSWIFISTFLLYLYWITLFRRIYALGEVPITLVTYTVASLRQYFYFIALLYMLVFISYFVNY